MALTNKLSPATTEEAGPLVVRWIRTPMIALSFWSAITLPLLYLPLFASGIETTTGLMIFLALFGMHLLALVGGHGHHHPSE